MRRHINPVILNAAKNLLPIAIFLLLLTSCAKQGPGLFKGNYTFKTSGTLTVSSNGDSGDWEYPDDPGWDEAYSKAIGDVSIVNLVNETGQMDIIRKESGSQELLITMNILNGAMITIDGYTDGKTLELDSFERTVTVNAGTNSDVLRPNATVLVTGSAVKYDDMVVFTLEYEGSYTIAGITYEILSSDVKCVAKRNK